MHSSSKYIFLLFSVEKKHILKSSFLLIQTIVAYNTFPLCGIYVTVILFSGAGSSKSRISSPRLKKKHVKQQPSSSPINLHFKLDNRSPATRKNRKRPLGKSKKKVKTETDEKTC